MRRRVATAALLLLVAGCTSTPRTTPSPLPDASTTTSTVWPAGPGVPLEQLPPPTTTTTPVSAIADTTTTSDAPD